MYDTQFPTLTFSVLQCLPQFLAEQGIVLKLSVVVLLMTISVSLGGTPMFLALLVNVAADLLWAVGSWV